MDRWLRKKNHDMRDGIKKGIKVSCDDFFSKKYVNDAKKIRKISFKKKIHSNVVDTNVSMIVYGCHLNVPKKESFD